MEAVLFIGGSDCSAGAGIQADLKVAWEYNIYGISALTSITAQTAQAFVSLEFVPPKILQEQIHILWDTFEISIVKTGLIGNTALLGVLTHFFKNKTVKIICDTVLKTSTGYGIADNYYIESLKNDFFPLVHLVTPNKYEAFRLLGMEATNDEHPLEVLQHLKSMIVTPNILLKGGHWGGSTSDDYLLVQAEENRIYTLEGTRIEGVDLHGSGCRLASAIACEYALNKDLSLIKHVEQAKQYVFKKMKNTGDKFYFI